MAGSIPSPERCSAERFGRGARVGRVMLAMLAALAGGTRRGAGAEEPLRPYIIVGDAIPASLTGKSGFGSAAAHEIVTNRQVGLCLLCHSGPFPQERFQGTLAPSLKGAGTRSTEGQLRLRIVDASKLEPDTIMPPYYRIDGLERVAASFQGKPILTAEQIEDVVAYLVTLRD